MKTLPLIFLSFITFCKHQDKSSTLLSFEGQIVYDVNYPKHIVRDKTKVASVIVVFYKNGYIRKEYKTDNEVLLNYTIYDPKSNMTLNFMNGSDTVSYYYPEGERADINSPPISTARSSDEKIIGYSCKKVEVSDADQDYVYYVSDDLKIDTTGIAGASHNVVFGDFVILKYYLKKPGLKEVTATKITQKKIEQGIFKLDTVGKTLVELK